MTPQDYHTQFYNNELDIKTQIEKILNDFISYFGEYLDRKRIEKDEPTMVTHTQNLQVKLQEIACYGI